MKIIKFAYHRTKGKKNTKGIMLQKKKKTGRENYVKKMIVIRVKYFIKSRREKPVKHLFEQGIRT